MDLLEYMRSQNDMTQAEWERTFEEEAKEILVLLAGGSGAGKMNGFWDVSHYFIAYVDCQTGALHTGDGRIVYPVSDEESDVEESSIASVGRGCIASRRARRFRTRFPRA